MVIVKAFSRMLGLLYTSLASGFWVLSILDNTATLAFYFLAWEDGWAVKVIAGGPDV